MSFFSFFDTSFDLSKCTFTFQDMLSSACEMTSATCPDTAFVFPCTIHGFSDFCMMSFRICLVQKIRHMASTNLLFFFLSAYNVFFHFYLFWGDKRNSGIQENWVMANF